MDDKNYYLRLFKSKKKRKVIFMKCENCGNNDANVKYTQIINGEKKQMFLCEACSEKMGINDIHFNMPISFNSFLEDFFSDMSGINLMPTLGKDIVQCSKCGLTWDNFLHTGKFGCSNCYDDFELRIDPILRSLQGATTHMGRIGNIKEGNDIKQNFCDKNVSKLEKLKGDLKKAIQDERYEDAAKLRDEINKIEK